jgi:hypothetical protein
MTILYLMIMVGILNGARGSGESFFTSKGLIGLYLGLIMVILTGNIYLFSIGILFYLATVLGWGKGFAVVHGIYTDEKEIEPLDVITDSFLLKSGKLNGFIWMTLRGILFIPIFWGSLKFGLVGLLMGAVYYVSGVIVSKNLIPSKNPIRIAECTFGSLLGLFIALCYL